MTTEKQPAERFRIPRSGMAPIVLTGWLVRSISTKGEPMPTRKGPVDNRWYELSLHFSRNGKYVASVAFLSDRENESPYYWAEAGTASEVADFLSELDGLPPTYHVGYAPGSQNWKSYQNRLNQWLAQQYDGGVSSLLAGLPEFEEEV